MSHWTSYLLKHLRTVIYFFQIIRDTGQLYCGWTKNKTKKNQNTFFSSTKIVFVLLPSLELRTWCRCPDLFGKGWKYQFLQKKKKINKKTRIEILNLHHCLDYCTPPPSTHTHTLVVNQWDMSYMNLVV